jgi:hypothetical protein
MSCCGALVSIVTNFIHLSMPLALQRVVPTRDERGHARRGQAGAAGRGLPSTLIALLVTLNARDRLRLLGRARRRRPRLPTAVALFVWALPLWTFIEVATSAARAARLRARNPPAHLLGADRPDPVRGGLLRARRGQHRADGRPSLLAGDDRLALRSPCSAAITILRLLIRAPIPPRLVRELLVTGLACCRPTCAPRPDRRTAGGAQPDAARRARRRRRRPVRDRAQDLDRAAHRPPGLPICARALVLGPGPCRPRPDRAALSFRQPGLDRARRAARRPARLRRRRRSEPLPPARPRPCPCSTSWSRARAVEAIVGPASTIVEMIGHRGLPLLNSASRSPCGSAWPCGWRPNYGALGMAVAVGVATVASTYAATLQLQISDGLTPFDRKLPAARARPCRSRLHGRRRMACSTAPPASPPSSRSGPPPPG